MSVVDVDRLTKSFDGRQALCAVTFSLQPGERLVVAGAPGCGRTTLCRVLMGILAPTSGSARVFGHDALLGGRICRQRTGYLPAQPRLQPELDAAEHLRQRLAYSPRASAQHAGQLLERLELPAGLCVRDMTPLQQRLLSLALALFNIIDIAAGYSHSLAVGYDGVVYAWGSNSYGQLGDGTTESSSVPIQAKTIKNAVQVAAGTDCSLALTQDSKIYSWGYGEYGQLGNGTGTI